MAQNADSTCRAIAGYLGRKLAVRTEFVADVSWEEREALLDAARIHLCWICGLPYAWKADRVDAAVELCAVPVMSGERYGRQPVYFSDVIVRRNSSFESFADLRGSSWAYNEPRSHSGHNVVRHHLARLGHRSGYFGRVVESGAHQTSLRMIVNGEIDASAVDSTVLEAELRRSSRLAADIRVIATLGPSPMPPWVVLKSLPEAVRTSIRTALLEMHSDDDGMQILHGWGISRFVVSEDGDYDALRHMERDAANVSLTTSKTLRTDV